MNPETALEAVHSQPSDKASFQLKRWIAPALAMTILLAGAGVLVQTISVNRQVEEKITQPVPVQASSEGAKAPALPDEQPVDAHAKASYSVAPDLPRLIKIDRLAISGRVLQVGVLADGTLDTPRNIYDAGWYSGSSKPGQAGATLIVGHLTGIKNVGLFANLDKLVVGDVIRLERGDGKLLSYRVMQMRQFDAAKVDMASTLVPITPGKPGLNLLTCAGEFIPSTNDFTHRLVVYTEQI